jgi:alpha-L-rhamnosidase
MNDVAADVDDDMGTDQRWIGKLDGSQMIGAEADYGTAIRLGTSFALVEDASNVTDAHLVATSLGVYEAKLNGRPVSRAVLSPGWTSYEWRLQVQATDVTSLVKGQPGEQSLELTVGNGWYRGRLGFEKQESNYGEKIGAIATLAVRYADGTEQLVQTDLRTWRARASDITYNSLYNGETIDARLRGHERPLQTRPIEFDKAVLVPQAGPAVVRQETVHPQKVMLSPSGKTLIDFGQNLVGWIRFAVRGEEGASVVVKYAEVLEHGELGMRPLRHAKATDTFILSGGLDRFEPTMTCHGFRYIQVEGWPENVVGEKDIEAVVVGSELRRTGFFECSNADVNQLVHNSVWSQKGNTVDIPTDCPQRDEREGWTGDIAVYAPTAAFQFDVSDFLHKWLLDLRAEAEHSARGIVPMVVPDIVKLKCPDNVAEWVKNATAIWGDASIWVPQALWRAYGDIEALRSHYPAMKLHLDSVEKMIGPDGLWDSGFQFGDWLDPVAPPDRPADAKADKYVVAQACLYRDAVFAAEAAEALGHVGDAAHWRELAEHAKEAFNRAYVHDGTVESDSVTVYALALVFGLLDGADVQAAADRVAELVRENGYRVSTGFAGTPYITWALSEHGHVEDAYRLLLERDCPSWMYPVSMGATTVWERWDSMLPDGSINPGEMTSFNHYALGAVCDWVYQVVGGIRPAEPGYRSVLVKPEPGPGIDWARTLLDSPVGRIEVHWKKVSESWMTLEVNLPGEVPATIVLPDGSTWSVTGGHHVFGSGLAAGDA